MRNVRGILKAKDAPTNHKRRVQFDPLALLLDASLEGEIELVKKVIDKVSQEVFLSFTFCIFIKSENHLKSYKLNT